MSRSTLSGSARLHAAAWFVVFIGWNLAHAATCYVKPGAPDGNDGSTWAMATALQSALANADCSELWVAAGVYKPTATTNRSISFAVIPGTAVYGGFAGSETERTQRDPATNVTVLSGDIDGNDTGVGGIDQTTADIQGGNTYHVVKLDGTGIGQPVTAATVIDGFVITGGEANGSYPDSYGGGLFCNAALVVTAQCSPTLNGLVFSGNAAEILGGALLDWAIYGGSASPTISNTVFTGNAVRGSSSTGHGGAVYNEGYGGISSPTFADVTFIGNSASSSAGDAAGGALYNSGYGGVSNPSLTNVTFSGNNAIKGGAVFNDGTSAGTSSPQLTNVTFSGNTASGFGGGMYNDGASGTSSPVLTNVTFSGNSAGNGGAIYDNGTSTGSSTPLLTNAILWGNSVGVGGAGAQIEEDSGSATILYSVVEGGCPTNSVCGTGVLVGDPLLGPLQNNGGFTQTLAIGDASSAANSGSDAVCPATDQRDVARPQGAHCDIGAYEIVGLIFAGGFEVR